MAACPRRERSIQALRKSDACRPLRQAQDRPGRWIPASLPERRRFGRLAKLHAIALRGDGQQGANKAMALPPCDMDEGKPIYRYIASLPLVFKINDALHIFYNFRRDLACI
jgi:hypothetical protein